MASPYFTDTLQLSIVGDARNRIYEVVSIRRFRFLLDMDLRSAVIG